MKLNLNPQAEAFGCFLQVVHSDRLRDANFVPYMNGRERGFVVFTDFDAGFRWAFFEHRNSDSLCCVRWYDKEFPKDFYTSDDIPEKDYPTKWDITKSFDYANFGEAATWLMEEIEAQQVKAA